ncbi:MAG: SGNH/GDSL hydrolase family protein [Clostridia bacterium]|nr:SGNH/GDSL hydrolase family protein [Clostridia bacterium]
MMEKNPLDTLVSDGGFCGIFRTIGCIGDSLSSGELESLSPDGQPGYHDYYEYSWGQYIARATGAKVYNFSRGGMSAMEYHTFAEENGFWGDDCLCQCYILALGVNDRHVGPIGTIDDIDFDDYNNNAETFAGYYGKIIQRLREKQPKARIFLMTMPRDDRLGFPEFTSGHTKLLHELADRLPFTYVLDLNKYAPDYDEEFRKKYYLGGHLSPAGYLLTARMVMTLMDHIIQENMDDFKQVGFIGTPYYNCNEKW